MPASIQISLTCPECGSQLISFFDKRNGYHYGECIDCKILFTPGEVEELDKEVVNE